MDVVRQRVTFLDSALSLLRQAMQRLPQVAPNLPIDPLLAVLRDEDHVVLTLPSPMA